MKQSITFDDRYYLGLHNPKLLAEHLYFEQFGKQINWSNPLDLNEKINWLAFNTDTSIWTTLSDKYLVRDYLISKGLITFYQNFMVFGKIRKQLILIVCLISLFLNVITILVQ